MRLRAPRRGESEAVHAVILARDVADMGRPDYTVQDVRDDWEMPGVDIERDIFVVEDDDGSLIGWADVGEGSARVAVHPCHERRGVGTLLREAIEQRTRELGHRVAQSYESWHAEVAAGCEQVFRLVIDDEAGIAGAALGERWEHGVRLRQAARCHPARARPRPRGSTSLPA